MPCYHHTSNIRLWTSFLTRIYKGSIWLNSERAQGTAQHDGLFFYQRERNEGSWSTETLRSGFLCFSTYKGMTITNQSNIIYSTFNTVSYRQMELWAWMIFSTNRIRRFIYVPTHNKKKKKSVSNSFRLTVLEFIVIAARFQLLENSLVEQKVPAKRFGGKSSYLPLHVSKYTVLLSLCKGRFSLSR